MPSPDSPSVMKRRQRVVDGKPIIDYQLAELGGKLKELTIRRDEMNRVIRDINIEQDARLAELRKQSHLEIYDAGDHYGVVNESFRQMPSDTQAEILSMFQVALDLATDRSILDRTYDLAIRTRCQFTNWTSPFGEDVMVAYARRVAELEEQDADAV